MSGFDDRKSAPMAWHPAHGKLALEILRHNQRVAEAMASVARLRGGGAALDEARRKFWAMGIDALIPVPGQQHDTRLSDVVITKGKALIKLKLEAGDVEAAERLARETGKSFDECLELYSAINIMNTPSYQGGELIQKGARVK